MVASASALGERPGQPIRPQRRCTPNLRLTTFVGRSLNQLGLYSPRLYREQRLAKYTYFSLFGAPSEGETLSTPLSRGLLNNINMDILVPDALYLDHHYLIVLDMRPSFSVF